MLLAVRAIYFSPIQKAAEVMPKSISHSPPSTSIHDHLKLNALLPTLAKVLESIVSTWLMSTEEPSLDDCQFGCRERQSTGHTLTAILNC